MGVLSDFIQRWKERKSKAKEIEDDVRIHEKIIEKKKSANERELESYLEEERQKQIKAQVEHFRTKKKNEYFHSPSALATPNVFKKKSPAILKTRNMFK